MSIQQQVNAARSLPVLVFLLITLAGAGSARAFPCCLVKNPTFRAEMAAADVAVIARFQFAVPPDQKTGTPHAQFEIVEVLKGEKRGLIGGQVVIPYWGEAAAGDFCFLSKTGPPTPEWSIPQLTTPRLSDYVRKISELPDDPVKRFLFFSSHFEDTDALIARDAFDEYDETPYAELHAFQSHLSREQLLRWLDNPETFASRKRLYYKLLSLCGTAADTARLEAKFQSADKRERSGFDQLLACYITLKGESGLAIVADRYLKNKQADYADSYSAIMACRFHLAEVNALPRDRVIAALKQMLQRPDLADLVIPDLEKLEDWTAADQLFEMYKTADPKTSWVRIPVINYLRACPLPQAPAMLQECERLDPQAFERAKKLFPD